MVLRHVRAEVRVHEHVLRVGTQMPPACVDGHTHVLLIVNPRTWHMGSLALDVWDVAKREDLASLSRMGKLVRRGRRILTGEIVTGRAGYCSARLL